MEPDERNEAMLQELGFTWEIVREVDEKYVLRIELGETWAKFTGDVNGLLGSYLMAWKSATTAKHFHLYDGSSEDGRGMGKYVGRTLDPKKALEHHYKVRSSWYSTGKVDVVTDDKIGKM